MSEILIIGYGNSLRGDDAVGFAAARELQEHFRGDAAVEVIASQQLTPEMADDIARSKFVLFVDVAHADPPGSIRRSAVLPEPSGAGITHQLTASALLHAAEQLYGDAPEAASVTLAGWSFELSNGLSRGAQLRLPALVGEVQAVVAERRHNGPTTSPDGARRRWQDLPAS